MQPSTTNQEQLSASGSVPVSQEVGHMQTVEASVLPLEDLRSKEVEQFLVDCYESVLQRRSGAMEPALSANLSSQGDLSVDSLVSGDLDADIWLRIKQFQAQQKSLADQLKGNDDKHQTQLIHSKLRTIEKEFYNDLHLNYGFNDLAKDEAGYLQIPFAGEPAQLQKIKEELANHEGVSFRKVDLSQQMIGQAHISLAVTDKDGRRIGQSDAIYFTAHYDNDGKLKEMTYPKGIQLGSSDDAPIKFTHLGQDYYLPISSGKFRQMQEVIEVNAVKDVADKVRFAVTEPSLSGPKSASPVALGALPSKDFFKQSKGRER
jgi:hypothetical protein